MNPLFFVHWGRVNQAFVVLCWLAVFVLLFYVLLKTAGSGHTVGHHAIRPLMLGH